MIGRKRAPGYRASDSAAKGSSRGVHEQSDGTVCHCPPTSIRQIAPDSPIGASARTLSLPLEKNDRTHRRA